MNNRTTKQAVACTKTATLRGKLTDGITMAKRLLAAVALSVAFFGSAYAQQQVAVLQRGDSVLGVYYGVNSFIDAMNASANGDIITLSGGTFNSGNALSKAITIRGAGAVEDTARGIIPTVFNGNFRCDNIPATATYHLTVEGVMFVEYLSVSGGSKVIQSPEFIRCIFNKSSQSNRTTLNNGIYVNCVFRESTSIDRGYENGTFTNCVLWDGVGNNGTINLNNCVVRSSGESNINAYNTIFFRKSNATSNPSVGSNLYNCVIIGGTLSNVLNSTNTVLPADSLSAVFATFTNSSNDINYSTSYALTDRAAANFLGIDGTQVGIYGGAMPFGYVPTYNVIRRCTVAPRSTADGKLSVDIELETEQ